jgi:myo-inositol-1(or 4)-monophosphatase
LQHLSLIATGFPYYDFEIMENYLNILNKLMQKSNGLRRFGASSVDLVYTAGGRFEVFFEYNLKP